MNKYTSPDIQNECIKLVVPHTLRQVSNRIATSHCYSILADECTDSANQDQFTINIRSVDTDLNVSEDFIGLYQVDTINSECLVSAIKDILVSMNASITDCRGQCYDGASNMSGSKNGVATPLFC